MQAIQTKYLPPTNSRGSRIKAWCDRGSITVGYDHGASNPHKVAVEALLRKFIAEDKARYGSDKTPWYGPWVEGGLPNNGGSCFVCAWEPFESETAEIKEEVK
jgi:hypothetical protein